MILSALRMADKLSVISHQYSDFHCSDVDYQTAEMIGNKLILHMAAAYRMIKGAEEVSVPKVQALDQRKMLLSLLPEEFESKTLVAEAASQGISRATALRWNDEWQNSGLIQKIKYGVYKKLHDTVETLDTLGRNCLNCIKCLMQICTASVVRHIIPLPTLFLASEFYSDISSVDRIVSDSLVIR